VIIAGHVMSLREMHLKRTARASHQICHRSEIHHERQSAYTATSESQLRKGGEAMNPPENSADRGAGSGCMARLVRCSSFLRKLVFGVSIPKDWNEPETREHMKWWGIRFNVGMTVLVVAILVLVPMIGNAWVSRTLPAPIQIQLEKIVKVFSNGTPPQSVPCACGYSLPQ
jgi:hypothetical protein